MQMATTRPIFSIWIPTTTAIQTCWKRTSTAMILCQWPDFFRELINTVLLEHSEMNDSFLNPAYANDLTLSVAAQVRVTFIHEGAGYLNAVGYYTYTPESFDDCIKSEVDTDDSGIVSLEEFLARPGVEIGWVFPNASRKEDMHGILEQGIRTCSTMGGCFRPVPSSASF